MKFDILKAVILGAPGCGKGTIASRITKAFDIIHVSSGDILRSHVTNKTALGLKAKEYIERGDLVPDQLMIDVIIGEISKYPKVNCLIDGFPRTVDQARALEGKQPIGLALNIVVPFDEIIDRIRHRWVHPGSGRVYNTIFAPPKEPGKDDITGEALIRRADDMEDVVAQRLKIYSLLSNPVLDYYRERGVLNDFHGKTTNEIWPKVQDFLTLHVSRRMAKQVN